MKIIQIVRIISMSTYSVVGTTQRHKPLSSNLLSTTVKIQIYRTVILPVFCIR